MGQIVDQMKQPLNSYSVEKPTINSRIVRSPSTEPQDLYVYGSTVVEFYGDHVRMSLDDWNKYKQRLIPVLKQGDMKYGSTETGS